MKIGENLARNISNLEEKLQEAVDHINTYYEVEDTCVCVGKQDNLCRHTA